MVNTEKDDMARKKISIVVSGSCRECPLKIIVPDHGSSFPACSHPEAPSGYGNVLMGKNLDFPEWCPAETLEDDNE